MVSNKALLQDGGCISSRSYINMNMTYNDSTSNTATLGGCMSFDDNIEINTKIIYLVVYMHRIQI